MKLNAPTLGIAVTVTGVFLLLGLRFWASPVALAVTGRDDVSVVTFLAMPLVLAVIGAGIVLFVWGPDLELST